MKYIQIEWLASHIDEARKIASQLVQDKLVACANIIPNIESIYIWEEKLESSPEVKVSFKTTSDHFEAVKSYIEAHSSYQVPCILQMEINGGNAVYLEWMSKATRKPKLAKIESCCDAAEVCCEKGS